jgi:hypothetical protein
MAPVDPVDPVDLRHARRQTTVTHGQCGAQCCTHQQHDQLHHLQAIMQRRSRELER